MYTLMAYFRAQGFYHFFPITAGREQIHVSDIRLGNRINKVFSLSLVSPLRTVCALKSLDVQLCLSSASGIQIFCIMSAENLVCSRHRLTP